MERYFGRYQQAQATAIRLIASGRADVLVLNKLFAIAQAAYNQAGRMGSAYAAALLKRHLLLYIQLARFWRRNPTESGRIAVLRRLRQMQDEIMTME